MIDAGDAHASLQSLTAPHHTPDNQGFVHPSFVDPYNYGITNQYDPNGFQYQGPSTFQHGPVYASQYASVAQANYHEADLAFSILGPCPQLAPGGSPLPRYERVQSSVPATVSFPRALPPFPPLVLDVENPITSTYQSVAVRPA